MNWRLAMLAENKTAVVDGADGATGRTVARSIQRAGRVVALAGVVLPLLLIGGLKFTQVEVEALKPVIGGTLWLAWMYPVFGEAGASYLLGVVEIATALLLVGSPWSPRAGVVGGALGGLTFLVTTSLLLALPVWEASLGGFPALGAAGQFVIKDIALLGISLVVLGESLARVADNATARPSPWT
jgi:reactive chlorine resistance protein C